MPSALPVQVGSGPGADLTRLYDAIKPLSYWGAYGDGTNQRTAINRAFAEVGAGGAVWAPVGDYRFDDTLVNPGVSIIGENMLLTQFIPTATFPLANNLMEVTTTAGSEVFMRFSDFIFYPAGVDGVTKRGAKAFVLTPGSGANIPMMDMWRCYFAPGNDWSVDLGGTVLGNPNGSPSTSRFEDLVVYSGFRAGNLGDSVIWSGGTYRANAVTRSGLDLTWISNGASKGAGSPTFDTVNGGGLGTVLKLRNGRGIRILNPNFELGNDAGSTGGANSCVIDALGDTDRIIGLEIVGGEVSIFGDSIAHDCIRIGNVQGAKVRGKVKMGNGTAAPINSAIKIVSTSLDAEIEPKGYILEGSFANEVDDAGVGTAGVQKAITFAKGNNTATYRVATHIRRGDYVECDGYYDPDGGTPVTTGDTIFTLPAGLRPSGKIRRQIVTQDGGGVIRNITIDINTNGTVVYQGPNAPDRGTFPLNQLSFEIVSSNAEVP